MFHPGLACQDGQQRAGLGAFGGQIRTIRRFCVKRSEQMKNQNIPNTTVGQPKHPHKVDGTKYPSASNLA